LRVVLLFAATLLVPSSSQLRNPTLLHRVQGLDFEAAPRGSTGDGSDEDDPDRGNVRKLDREVSFLKRICLILQSFVSIEKLYTIGTTRIVKHEDEPCCRGFRAQRRQHDGTHFLKFAVSKGKRLVAMQEKGAGGPSDDMIRAELFGMTFEFQEHLIVLIFSKQGRQPYFENFGS